MTLRKPNRRTFLKTTAGAAAATSFAAPFIAKGAEGQVFKLGSLAPENSFWHKEFKHVGAQINELTGGEVTFKYFVGGVMGDEKAMIRKVRTGQLDGAAVTTNGLGQIDKRVLIMQLPMLFSSSKMVDYCRDKMSPTFTKMFNDAGFTEPTWGDVGDIYMFTNTPVKVPSDLKKCLIWQWSIDEIIKLTMKSAGVNGVELDVGDVLPSLQTGLINAFPASPYAAIALQWYTKATHVTNLKLAMGIGASVMSLKKWNELSDAHKEIIRNVLKESQPRLLKKIRSANAKAITTLQQKGISVVEPEGIGDWANIAITVKNKLTGKLFPAELLEELEGHIKASKSG